MAYETLLVETRGRVGLVTLNRPQALNALNRKLLDELIPDRVPTDLLLTVLKLLLEERVSVRNLPLVLEAIAEARGQPTPEAVCDHVRQRLGFQIVAELKREDGTIPLLQLAPEWEKTFATYQIEGERGLRDVALPPEQLAALELELAAAALEQAQADTLLQRWNAHPLRLQQAE